ncbi:MAG: choice-of-anchor J domain-containing protein [Bacteroidales bacterium]|nr:choice-of-anchor J domain-containing protein [Bacteroidales bacterium]
MMKRIFLISWMLLVASIAMSAPVKNMPVKCVQPQGDTLYCFVSGDEFYHRLHDAEDFTIIQNVETGEYVYAMLQDGKLAPTHYRPGMDNPASVGLVPGLKPGAAELSRLHKAWDIPEVYKLPAVKTSGANHGILNNVVIFIRFSDEGSCTSTPFNNIAAMFNDSTIGANSMFNYFWHSSYQNLRIVTHFYPAPSGNTILSYQDSHPRSYYQPYSATNSNGYTDSDERRNREFSLLENAVNYVSSSVPTTLNLDMDNDGQVDNVCFVVSGTYTGWNDMLWPHKWGLYDRVVNINGKRVYTYNLQLANSGDHYFGVTTFCHEMTHTLGCPDLYHYNEYTTVSAAGSWDLMEYNQNPPQQTNSLFKYHFLNWFDSIPLLSDTGNYTIYSNASAPNHAYKIASPNRNQWYILEYRNSADTFDSSIPNSGLLIWRYNTAVNASNSGFDYFNTPHQLWLFRPNSHCDTVNGNDAQAGFGLYGRNAFHAGASNYPYLCNGTVDTSFLLTNIQVSADHQSVSFTFTPTGIGSCGTVNNFPLTEGFEDGTTSCWTLESADPANDGRIGVFTSSTSTPHSGSYSFRFSSYDRATNYHQYLISPQLNHANPLRMQFYYKKSNTANEHFMVTYSTTGNAVSDFTDTIINTFATSTSWQSCNLLVPQSARYVAIDYCSDYLYYLYIDDISLVDTLQAEERDTTFIHVHDTLYNWQHDTVYITLIDTVFHHTELTRCDTIHITDVITDTIMADIPFVRLKVLSHDVEQGEGVGNGLYRLTDTVHIGALPYQGHRFVRWMDGNTSNPRTVCAGDGLDYVAFFEAVGMKDSPRNTAHDTLVVHDTVWVTLTITDTVYSHSQLHYYDTAYVTLPPVYDTSLVYDTLVLDTAVYYSFNLVSANPDMGMVIGGGAFAAGTLTEFAPLPFEGYRFVRWSDGVEESVRSMTIGEDVYLEALYAPDQVSPEQVDEVDGLQSQVYSMGSTVIVKASVGGRVMVFNIMGQLVAQDSLPELGGEVRFGSLQSGVYLVRVGLQSAHKVLIMNN